MSDLLWFVAHTRPRCEKKLILHCEREGFPTTLPCYRAVHKYRGKTIAFDKPLFPGYVFVHILSELRREVFQSDYIANLLDVPDQEVFKKQLNEILQALGSGLEIQLAPAIGQGSRVRIKSGPLQGIEGWVEKRYGLNTVLLRLDFIGQAAAVKCDVVDLELL